MVQRIYKGILVLLGGLFLLAPYSPAALADKVSENIGDIRPMQYQVHTTKEVLKQLKHNHYRKQDINDDLSSEFLEAYISKIDPSRQFFLASDIREFDSYRNKMDDALCSGDLSPAFKIYNRYHLRAKERLSHVINLIELGLDTIKFDVDETLLTEREDSPWPVSSTEMDELWRKRLKNEVLSLKLTDKSIEEITDTLGKRYRNQLHRLDQNKSEDVFQIYLNAFTQTYDPHTQYFSPRSTENFNINMSLSLEGIGAMLTKENEHTKVVRLIPAGPAQKAGQLRPDDRIVGVGQGAEGEIVDVVGWRLDDVVDLIRGPKETMVRLEIIPVDSVDEHQTKTIKIVRNTVKLEEQASQKAIIDIEKNGIVYKMGVIDIPTFYLDIKGLQEGKKDFKSTTNDVRKILGELAKSKVDGIMIDLRDNGGGSLQEATALTGLFIKRGPTVQIRYATSDVDTLYDRDPRIFYSGPLIVIVNRLSASASEIFAGAIQDYNRGIIVGENTFGKGTVQTLLPLSHGQLKVTTAKFYRVSGASTQHKGVIPDIYYPSLYDMDTIGESSLDEALPWDTIAGVRHRKYMNIPTIQDRLIKLHNDRMLGDPDYTYLLSSIEHFNKMKKKDELSLNEVVRKQELDTSRSWRLENENKRRKAKGMEILSKLDDKQEDDEDIKSGPDPKDPVLIEGANILTDIITGEDVIVVR